MKKFFIIAAMTMISFAVSAQDFKFGYVDFTELTQLMPEMDSARVQLDAASVEAQETYNAMIEEYQTKAQQFQQKQASWTPAVRESKQSELQQIEYRIQEFQQAIQQDLQQLQNSLQAPIYEKNSLLYVDPAQGVNLTPEARIALGIPEGRTLETLQQELQAKAQAAQLQ